VGKGRNGRTPFFRCPPFQYLCFTFRSFRLTDSVCSRPSAVIAAYPFFRTI
jgi:hypothetical protein